MSSPVMAPLRVRAFMESGDMCPSHLWASMMVSGLLAECVDAGQYLSLLTLYRPSLLGNIPMRTLFALCIAQVLPLKMIEYLASLMCLTDTSIWVMSGVCKMSQRRIFEWVWPLGTCIVRSPCLIALKVHWFTVLMGLRAMAW